VARAKDVLGRRGEDIAAAHLDACGFEILARNWRCRQGELDIVALDGTVLVVCEVKTRTSRRYGDPLECVTPVKLDRLRRLAASWVADHRPARLTGIRVDVVGVVCAPGEPPSVAHIRGADQ